MNGNGDKPTTTFISIPPELMDPLLRVCVKNGAKGTESCCKPVPRKSLSVSVVQGYDWGTVEVNVVNDGKVGFQVDEEVAREICNAEATEDISVSVEVDSDSDSAGSVIVIDSDEQDSERSPDSCGDTTDSEDDEDMDDINWHPSHEEVQSE